MEDSRQRNVAVSQTVPKEEISQSLLSGTLTSQDTCGKWKFAVTYYFLLSFSPPIASKGADFFICRQEFLIARKTKKKHTNHGQRGYLAGPSSSGEAQTDTEYCLDTLDPVAVMTSHSWHIMLQDPTGKVAHACFTPGCTHRELKEISTSEPGE